MFGVQQFVISYPKILKKNKQITLEWVATPIDQI